MNAKLLFRATASALVLATMSPNAVFAAKHALVISNADYKEVSDLATTHGDADAYALLLKDFGYTVTQVKDVDRNTLFDTLDVFASGITLGDEVVFVYSGHGWSDGSVNYLVPTDAPLTASDSAFKADTVALQNGYSGILDRFHQAQAKLTVAIIDACRNNPFRPPQGRRSTALRSGLAQIRDSADGTFVIFSAGAGQEALDSLSTDAEDIKLSVFTRSFLPYLRDGLYLETAINKAQEDTIALARTQGGHRQKPAYYDETAGFSCLKDTCVAAVPPVQDDLSALVEERDALERQLATLREEKERLAAQAELDRQRREREAEAEKQRQLLEEAAKLAEADLLRRAEEEAAKLAETERKRQEEARSQQPDTENPEQARASEARLSAEERKDLQRALQREGFYTSVIDGDFGAGTRAAMSLWQSSVDVPETGVLTTLQRERLMTAYWAVPDSESFDRPYWETRRLSLSPHTDHVNALVISPNGRTIVTASSDKTAAIIDVDTGRVLRRLQGHADKVMSAAMSPDGRYIATGSDDKTTKIWDAATGDLLKTIRLGSTVWVLAFSSNGDTLFTGEVDGQGSLFRVGSWARIAQMSSERELLFVAKFTGDGSGLAFGISNNRVGYWNGATGRKVRNLVGRQETMYGLDISADGQFLVTGESHANAANVFDISTGEVRHTLSGHTDSVHNVAISPDGTRIATASADHTARLWDTRTGRLIKELKGHTYHVIHVAFSPDGTRLVTGSNDQTIRVWDGQTGELVASPSRQRGWLQDVTFSADGSFIATVDTSGDLNLWGKN